MLCATCVVARAELSPRGWPPEALAESGAPTASTHRDDVAGVAFLRGALESVSASVFYLDDLNRVVDANERAGGACSNATVVQLSTQTPSSAALFLYALGSVGAWQLGRSARKLPFGCVPEWYHADARQIGHATPLDLSFPPAIVQVIASYLVDVAPPGAAVTTRAARPRVHIALLTRTTRGPPARSASFSLAS